MSDEKEVIAGPSAEEPEPQRSPSGEHVDANLVREPRPLIERIGLAAVAAVLAILFGGVAAASWVGGEPFLAVMGGIGSLMTLWVGLLTLVRR
ncbi:MAG: hypothetical protein WEE50_04745 [Chloroflexota bacterium]